jgi:hypothetical protein
MFKVLFPFLPISIFSCPFSLSKESEVWPVNLSIFLTLNYLLAFFISNKVQPFYRSFFFLFLLSSRFLFCSFLFVNYFLFISLVTFLFLSALETILSLTPLHGPTTVTMLLNRTFLPKYISRPILCNPVYYITHYKVFVRRYFICM